MKALVVVEENHSQSSVLNGMPYLASLADTYGQTSAYRAVAHPSLPNYLAIIGGSTFGVTDDRPPADHPVPVGRSIRCGSTRRASGPSVLDSAIANAATAKAYIEDMPGPCTLVSGGDYAVKHNPWAYFTDPTGRRNCQNYDVPAGTATGGALHDDVQAGTLPTVGMLIPNLCHDAHNCPLGGADDWLRQWLPILMQGPDYRAGNLAIVITFDEDDNSGDNTVLTTVIAPTVHHISAATPLTHYSLTRYLAELTGTPPPARQPPRRRWATPLACPAEPGANSNSSPGSAEMRVWRRRAPRGVVSGASAFACATYSRFCAVSCLAMLRRGLTAPLVSLVGGDGAAL